jgi:hypothetical protein
VTLVLDRWDGTQSVYYPQCLCTLGVVFENFGDPKAPIAIPVRPTEATVFINSYREADTFSVTFDAKNLPVAPELIRAGSVELYFLNQRGIGQLPETVVPDDNDILNGISPTIVGLFDEASMDFSDGGRWVSIDGTDYTSLFLAKQWGAKLKANKKQGISAGLRNKRAPSGKPLDVILRTIMSEVESAAVMTLKVEPPDLPMPIVGRAEGRTNRKGIPVKDKDNYWDVMYDLAVRYGFILFVRGLDVVLTQPKVYVQERSKVKKLAWGRNLMSLRMTRKIGKETVPVIEVRSYDDKRQQIIKGRYPKSPKQQPITGLGTVRDEVRIMHVNGVRDPTRLEQIAQNAYELLARAEQEVEIETRDLNDLEGSSLLEIASGDAISVALEPYTTDLLEGQTLGQRYQTLVELGYDRLVAATIAATLDTVNVFRRPFRLKEATLQWSKDDGLSISMLLQNFINIQGEAP